MQDSRATKLRQATQVIQLLQGKWTLHILCAMHDRPVRLSGLRRIIPAASKKALTSSLRSLELAKVVIRKDLSASLLHVEYSLSEEAETSIIALLDQIVAWGAAHDEFLR